MSGPDRSLAVVPVDIEGQKSFSSRPVAIDVKDLSKSFGSQPVLKSVSLQIHEGEVVTIIGPSGSGKSTLLRCMNLLETPTSGSIKVLGQEITKPNIHLPTIRRQIGMVFQSFNLFPHMTAVENVAEGPRTVLGLSRKESLEIARDLLAKVGLADRASHRPNQCSGGQQQRIAIARALALRPKVMLFDEPTSALDPELRFEVLEVMRALAKDHMTMVVVTHEMGFARRVADRAIFIDEGIIVEEGAPKLMLQDPQTDRLQRFLNRMFWGDD